MARAKLKQDALATMTEEAKAKLEVPKLKEMFAAKLKDEAAFRREWHDVADRLATVPDSASAEVDGQGCCRGGRPPQAAVPSTAIPTLLTNPSIGALLARDAQRSEQVSIPRVNRLRDRLTRSPTSSATSEGSCSPCWARARCASKTY